MDIDERLQKLVERQEALTQSLEELKESVKSLEESVDRLVSLAERTDQRTYAILDGIKQLADVASSHERRLGHLEGGNQKVQ